ncbi:DUF1002 domain-containing protein [Clostridium grantii]|uniref:Uncharacterized protein YpuA, DUF1002 family n=1 Tax=Clostridium grantii DSM 8605 TaxID=1121316 RepID=A0A1M5VZA4_9CLOT|nr:DUF1002 domain-containing protein [Clostridium grantii]SHH80334.1 Uncharacterized protein YpuA, DUF1002 family [Clostridium grantii DSM 8605]
MKKILVLLLSLLLMTSVVAYGDSFKVVSLGNDLSEKQKADMLSIFNVKESEAEIILITNEDEKSYLSGIASSSQIGTRAISSAYIEPLPEESGLTVSTINLTWVTETMIANALTTAGVKDAKVIAAAPFNVSGTAALTGIIKGFEKATDTKLDVDATNAANMEIVTTGELGEDIGQEKAAEFMSDLKEDIVKNKLSSPEEITAAIERLSKDYNVQLSKEQIDQIIDVMQKISKLDINIDDITSQLKNISGKISQVLEQGEETKSFLSGISEILKNIGEWLKGIVSRIA